MAFTLSFPNLDVGLLKRMIAEAERRDVDMQVVAEEWLRRGAQASEFQLPEITSEDRAKLLSMAGSWTQEQADEFNRATAHFSKIDEELWK